MWFKQSCVVVALIGLAGCQSFPASQSDDKPKPATKPTVETPDGIKITPYDRPEIKREQIPVIVPPQKKVTQKFDNGRELPAFKNLLKQTQTAFQAGKWDEAEQAATHAQRLAPQSSETFMYLALISNHKNQPKNAESLARRGLSYAQTDPMKRQLWQIILKSASMQKDTKTMQEAQARLKAL